MDLELKNFQGSTAHYSSNSFLKGQFNNNTPESGGKVEVTLEHMGDKQSDGET
jgi:hypothetical protein